LLNSIISFLIAYNQFSLKQIRQLLLFIAKNIPLKDAKDNSSPHYTKLTVDKLPIIKQPEKLDYKELLREYRTLFAPIAAESLIKRRNVSTLTSTSRLNGRSLLRYPKSLSCQNSQHKTH